jgi:hypothetical protein
MKLTRSFGYVRRVLAPGELSRAFRLVLERLGVDPTTARFSITEVLADGTKSDVEASIKDLDPVCDPGARSVVYYKSGPDSLFISLSAYSSDLYSLHVETSGAENMEMVRQTFEEALHLDPPPISAEASGAERIAEALTALTSSSLTPLVERIEKLEASFSARSRRLRCFLSYRFSDQNDIVALRIEQFLAILDVEVLSGANYEPRQVSEKVLSKLREPLDFIIILITETGESMWTRDEIGAAIHKGIGLVPLVEKGAKFDPGLFADVEYVEYESGHIGDAFLKLAQAVRFVREQKAVDESPRETAG